jgi:hypothetical protein
VKVFTFALGAELTRAITLLQKIACENDGLFFQFDDNQDISTGMAS